MEVEQMMPCLLAEVRTNREEMKEDITARLEAMIQNSQEQMEARIGVNNEKFEVLRRTLVSCIDIHRARTEALEEKIRGANRKFLNCLCFNCLAERR
jgi:hypothetical protein